MQHLGDLRVHMINASRSNVAAQAVGSCRRKRLVCWPPISQTRRFRGAPAGLPNGCSWRPARARSALRESFGGKSDVLHFLPCHLGCVARGGARQRWGLAPASCRTADSCWGRWEPCSPTVLCRAARAWRPCPVNFLRAFCYYLNSCSRIYPLGCGLKKHLKMAEKAVFWLHNYIFA